MHALLLLDEHAVPSMHHSCLLRADANAAAFLAGFIIPGHPCNNGPEQNRMEFLRQCSVYRQHAHISPSSTRAMRLPVRQPQSAWHRKCNNGKTYIPVRRNAQ